MHVSSLSNPPKSLNNSKITAPINLHLTTAKVKSSWSWSMQSRFQRHALLAWLLWFRSLSLSSANSVVSLRLISPRNTFWIQAFVVGQTWGLHALLPLNSYPHVIFFFNFFYASWFLGVRDVAGGFHLLVGLIALVFEFTIKEIFTVENVDKNIIF